MSGKRRRDDAINEDSPSDADEDDNLDGGNGMPNSNPNYTVEELDDDRLESFGAESIEVQPGDVLTIKEITNAPCNEQSAVENLGDEILYEFPTELDEENDNQPPQTYFNNTDNFCFKEKVYICDINDAPSFSRINEKQKNKMLKKKKNKEVIVSELFQKGIVSESDWKNVQGTSTKSSVKNVELKGEKPSGPEIHNHKRQSIRIFDFNCSCEVSELSNVKQNFKCPEHSSDEFADFEDSSASDSVEALSEPKTEQVVSMKGVKSNQGHNGSHKGGSKSRLIPVTCSSSSENDIPANKLGGENPPSTSKVNHEYPGIYFSQGNSKRMKTNSANISAEGNKLWGGMPIIEEPLDESDYESSTSTSSKKNFAFPKSFFSQDGSIRNKTVTPSKTASGTRNHLKGEMSTIVEVPEENEASNSSVPSQPRPNPLKMKAKVGYKKDRCNVCNIRLGLCAIKCRCGGYYCAKHRYDKEHNCTYDYKTMGAEEIRKNNPRVIAEKVRKL